jgi:hypothetical protein
MAWSDQVSESRSGFLERRLAAISSIESVKGDSIYSFSGHIRYAVADDHRQLHIKEYSVRGTHLDGPDLGSIEYCARGGWQTEVASDRSFQVHAEILWTDSSNTNAVVQSTLRGTLLENHRLAYISSSTSGVIALGEDCEGEVCLRTPANW